MNKPNELPSKLVLDAKKKLTNQEIIRAPTDEADVQFVARFIYRLFTNRIDINKYIEGDDKPTRMSICKIICQSR